MGQPEVTVPITLLLVKELTVKGSFRYGVRLCTQINNHIFTHMFYPKPGDYRLAIALVAQKKIDLKPLVTHRLDIPPLRVSYVITSYICRFAFDDAVAAFHATRAGQSDDGKKLIKAIISGPGVSTDAN